MGCLDGWNILGVTKTKTPLGYHRNYDMGWDWLNWAGLGWGAFRLLFSINEITAIIEQGETEERTCGTADRENQS